MDNFFYFYFVHLNITIKHVSWNGDGPMILKMFKRI